MKSFLSITLAFSFLISFGVFADETSSPTTTNAAVADTTAAKKKTKTAPVAPKKIEEPLNKVITIEGALAEEKGQIIRMAKKAGAADAEMEGSDLKIYGAAFNQDDFETLLADTIPGAKIK